MPELIHRSANLEKQSTPLSKDFSDFDCGNAMNTRSTIKLEEPVIEVPDNDDQPKNLPYPILPPYIDSSNFDLGALLSSTVTGNAIKSFYQKQKMLDTRCQSDLCEIIVEHLLSSTSTSKRMRNEDYVFVSNKIIEIFPNESALVYYTPPILKKHSRENRTVKARGKLVDKYRNKLSFLRKAGVIPCIRSPVEKEAEPTFDLNSYKDVAWLKEHQSPWSEVEQRWAQTFSIRQNFIKKDKKCSLKEILEEYPILNHHLGYVLIDYDFQRNFPENHNKIYKTFEHVFFKLYDLRKCKNTEDSLNMEIIKNSTTNREIRHLMMFNILASLLPARACKKIKPTLKESKDGVLVQVKHSDDVTNAVKERWEFQQKHGYPKSPFVIVETPSLTEIKSIWVSLDHVLYKPTTILKAIDICFQLYHSLNLQYPFQSENIWFFLERAVYQLDTKDRLIIPNIVDICNKIKIN